MKITRLANKQTNRQTGLRKEGLKKCSNRNSLGKKQKEEDSTVMICKYVKCFWNEERNNQFSKPREDRKRINGHELQPGRFKIDIK